MLVLLLLACRPDAEVSYHIEYDGTVVDGSSKKADDIAVDCELEGRVIVEYWRPGLPENAGYVQLGMSEFGVVLMAQQDEWIDPILSLDDCALDLAGESLSCTQSIFVDTAEYVDSMSLTATWRCPR